MTIKVQYDKKENFMYKQKKPVTVSAYKYKVEKVWIGGNYDQYTKDRIDFIEHCKNYGISYKEIGALLRISKQRVYALYRYGLNSLTERDKNEIRARDKNKCRICKRIKKHLHIHHIRNPKDKSKKNLISLCAKCHKKYEKVIKVKETKRGISVAIDKSK